MRSFRNAAREEWVLHPAWKYPERDLGTRTKQLGAKENARRKKCDVRFSLAIRNRVFQKSCMRIGARKLLRIALVFARVWEGKQWAFAPTERLRLERETAAAAGSLSLFMVVNNLERKECGGQDGQMRSRRLGGADL